MDLKQIEYKGFHQNANGRVAYFVDGFNVYFSGLTLPRESTSTINAAENVIQAICRAEGLGFQQYMFYDLQTHRGYHKEPYEFNLDRLTVHESMGAPDVVDWNPIELSVLSEAVQRSLRWIIDTPTL